MIHPVAEFESLPFLFRALGEPHNPPGIPDAYPFRLGVDQGTGRLVQIPSPELEAILGRAYVRGSMVTGMMSEEGIGRDYTEDFLSLLGQHLAIPLAGARILEIGCGSGYLLSRLGSLGTRECVGIDPGPHADQARERYGVDARRGFFPDVAPGGPFDLVIAYCLLEHVVDPVALLREAGRVLAPGGQVAVVVQDEEPYIRTGEISLLFHEHFSYFSGRTLRRTLLAAGGKDPTIARSRFSNLLFACCRWGATTTGPEDSPSQDQALASAFPGRAERLCCRWTDLVRSAARRPGGAAVYVPGRAANYLARLDPDIHSDLRLIDDNASLRGTYLPGIPIPIAGSDSLVALPPARTFVMSLSFGARIAERVRKLLTDRAPVTLLEELLDPES